MSEWISHRICELGNVITGNTPSSKNPEEFGNGMMFVTPSDYFSYVKYINVTERYLSTFGVSKLNKKVLLEDSIMVTCIGSDMGKVAMNNKKVITNQQINSIIPDKNKINCHFLYYKLLDEYDALRTYGQEGTAIPIVNKTTFENIVLSIPALLSEQESIAEVLSSLDDKIDLLHRNNKTLEQLAETLFRQWFVEEADQRVKIGDVIKTTSGGTPSRAITKYYTGEIPWIKSKELKNGFILITEEHITEDALKNSSAKIIPPFSILIAMYGTNVGELGITTKDTTCNQAVCAIPETKEYPFTFLFNYFKSIKDELINRSVGAAQQNISQVLIQDFEVVKTSTKIKKYDLIVRPFYNKILNNTTQIQQLESLRDTLLPKLMSGSVTVKI